MLPKNGEKKTNVREAKAVAAKKAKPAAKKPVAVVKPVVKPAMTKSALEKIVFNGGRYEISRADLEQLQTILSRATVVKEDKEPEKVKSDAKSVVAQEATATGTKLTDAVVERLVGHSNVIYYNCETYSFNKKRYNGFDIADDGRLREIFSRLQLMTVNHKCDNDYESCAFVMMPVKHILRDTEFTYVYNPDGSVFACNLIVKNKITGQYELRSKYWFDSTNYWTQGAAIKKIYEIISRNISYFGCVPEYWLR